MTEKHHVHDPEKPAASKCVSSLDHAKNGSLQKETFSKETFCDTVESFLRKISSQLGQPIDMSSPTMKKPAEYPICLGTRTSVTNGKTWSLKAPFQTNLRTSNVAPKENISMNKKNTQGNFRQDNDRGKVENVTGGEKRKLHSFNDRETAEFMQQSLVKKLKPSSEKDHMFEIFQPWALKNYGDQTKTKTITKKKKNRILKALLGQERSKPDSSKFRLWVKSKGFTTETPDNFRELSKPLQEQQDDTDLYVASSVKEFGEKSYRKVAVVEDFFDIIYNVHVELGGRGGRHAGQKRTYRIISETYAFLPREAVTKFLAACPTCKRNLSQFFKMRPDECAIDTSSELEVTSHSSHTEDSVSGFPAPLKTQHASFQSDGKGKDGKCVPEPLASTSTTQSNPQDNKNGQDEMFTIGNQQFCPGYRSLCFRRYSSGCKDFPGQECSQEVRIKQVDESTRENALDFEVGDATELEVPLSQSTPKSVFKKPASDTIPLQDTDCAINPIPTESDYSLLSYGLGYRSRSRLLTSLSNKKSSSTMIRSFRIDLKKVKPITATYLKVTRSMGLSDEDALRFDGLLLRRGDNEDYTMKGSRAIESSQYQRHEVSVFLHLSKISNNLFLLF